MVVLRRRWLTTAEGTKSDPRLVEQDFDLNGYLNWTQDDRRWSVGRSVDCSCPCCGILLFIRRIFNGGILCGNHRCVAATNSRSGGFSKRRRGRLWMALCSPVPEREREREIINRLTCKIGPSSIIGIDANRSDLFWVDAKPRNEETRQDIVDGLNRLKSYNWHVCYWRGVS